MSLKIIKSWQKSLQEAAQSQDVNKNTIVYNGKKYSNNNIKNLTTVVEFSKLSLIKLNKLHNAGLIGQSEYKKIHKSVVLNTQILINQRQNIQKSSENSFWRNMSFTAAKVIKLASPLLAASFLSHIAEKERKANEQIKSLKAEISVPLKMPGASKIMSDMCDREKKNSEQLSKIFHSAHHMLSNNKLTDEQKMLLNNVKNEYFNAHLTSQIFGEKLLKCVDKQGVVNYEQLYKLYSSYTFKEYKKATKKVALLAPELRKFADANQLLVINATGGPGKGNVNDFKDQCSQTGSMIATQRAMLDDLRSKNPKSFDARGALQIVKNAAREIEDAVKAASTATA